MEIDSDSDCVQVENVKVSSLNSLPEKSKTKYEAVYKWFMDWKEENKHMLLSEHVLLSYFKEISIKLKPSTLWAMYSMLKLTLNINNHVDIDEYTKLKEFLKTKSNEYVPRRGKTLTTNQVEKFIREAPDSDYLLTKVALVMAVIGGCRKRELYQMTVTNLEDFGTAVLITIPNTHSRAPRKFIISGKFYKVFKKFANLRPPNVQDSHFFLSYMKGKCAPHRTGINKFGLLGKQVAKYLNLPNAVLYTGYCFRHSGTIFGIDEDVTSIEIHDACESTTLADEIVKNQFGVTDKILSAIHTKAGTTSRMKNQEEFRSISPPQENDVSYCKASRTFPWFSLLKLRCELVVRILKAYENY